MKPIVKTQKQVAYLLSKVSPLNPKQETKLKKELHAHKVVVGPNKPSSK